MTSLVPATILRALFGLAVLQFALPKILPLPGVSTTWVLFFLGGGVPGIIAALVGGVLLAAWGASLVPPGLTPRCLGIVSAGAALLSRVAGLAVAAAIGAPIMWWPGEEPGTGAIFGLFLVVLVYGGVAWAISQSMRLARPHSPPSSLSRSGNRRLPRF